MTNELPNPVPADLLSEGDLFTIVMPDNMNGDWKVVKEGVRLQQPFGLSNKDLISTFLPNLEHLSIAKFFELTAEILADAQAREEIDVEKQIHFFAESQPEDFAEHGEQVITFKIVKREPGNMNAKGTGRPQYGYGYHHQAHLADDPNRIMVIDSRPIDHIVEFSVWAKTATMANRTALWLEDLLFASTWIYKSKGAERFHWITRDSDAIHLIGGQRIHQRALKFKVRLREFMMLHYPVRRHFDLELSL